MSDRRPATIPQLIKQIREARELTQEGLARELGVSFSTVNGWENGKHLPMPVLLKLLLGLGEQCGVRVAPGGIRESRGSRRRPSNTQRDGGGERE